MCLLDQPVDETVAMPALVFSFCKVSRAARTSAKLGATHICSLRSVTHLVKCFSAQNDSAFSNAHGVYIVLLLRQAFLFLWWDSRCLARHLCCYTSAVNAGAFCTFIVVVEMFPQRPDVPQVVCVPKCTRLQGFVDLPNRLKSNVGVSAARHAFPAAQ